MRTISWLGRIGLVTTALLLLPAHADETRLSSATLCASESGASGSCEEELQSYCWADSAYWVDRRSKS